MNTPCWNNWGSKEPATKWYYGGIAGAVATILTHPLDLLKVHLQTADTWFCDEPVCKENDCHAAAGEPEFCKPVAPTEGQSCSQCLQAESADACPPNRRPAVPAVEPLTPPSRTLTGAFWRVYNTNGPLGFYTGLSAALIRQILYSSIRYSAYEYAKQYQVKTAKRECTDLELVMMAGAAGALAGFLCAPAELVTVRMENDIKIPLSCRRYYSNGVQGLFNVLGCEGITGLFRGAAAASLRAAIIGIGQMAVYDIAKRELIKRGQKDTTATHLAAGITAAMAATALTLPLDVVKTRAMAAPASEQVGLLCGAESLYNAYGITGLFRGFVPAMLRVLPQTLITILIMEQLKVRFKDRR